MQCSDMAVGRKGLGSAVFWSMAAMTAKGALLKVCTPASKHDGKDRQEAVRGTYTAP